MKQKRDAQVPAYHLPAHAMMAPTPIGWDGECTMWFQRLPALRAWRLDWAYLDRACRLHDWHYAILRKHKGVWTDPEWDRFRLWADEMFREGTCALLSDHYPFWLAYRIANLMFRGVRVFGRRSALGT